MTEKMVKSDEMNFNNIYHGVISETVRTENFNISLTNHPAHSSIDVHAHDKPYLCLLVSGSYKEQGFKEVDICEGHAVFRTSNYEHANVFNTIDSVCLNIEFSNESESCDRNERKISSDLKNTRGSVACYRALYALKSGASKDLLEIYCHEAIVAHVSSENIKGNVLWIKKVQDYIEDNPHQAISLTELSDMLNIHPNYVVRKFKERTGYRLSEYLMKVRIEKSINKVINSEVSMTSIALNCGFYDQSHFNKNFKRQLEVSPSNYKKIVKG